MTRFQGTALSDFILPVINPNNLLEKGVIYSQNRYYNLSHLL